MPVAGDFPQASQVLIQPFDTSDDGLTYTIPTSGGRSYQIDTSFEAYRRQSTRHTTIQSQRESINLEGKTGEGTVNTEGLWRVQVPDWSYGAGQVYADRQGSVANRFLASTGVDVFSLPYQATLLNATKQVNEQQNNAAPLIVTLGPYVIWAYSGEVLWVRDSWSNAPTNLNFTGSDFAGGEIITGLMVDQHAVYISTTSALYQANILDGASPATAVKVISQGCITVGSAGGRYFVAGWGNQNILYDVTDTMTPGTPPTLPRGSGAFANGQLAVHPNPKWLWHTMALVDGGFYFSGQPLDNDSALVPNNTGEVWYTAFPLAAQTGTTNSPLPAPQICLTLPPGEIVNAMFQYGNLCVLGTTQGVRTCRTVSANDPEGNTGNLISGPIIPNLTQPVTGVVAAFTANGRFVWFTWNGYDDTFVGGTTTPANSVVLGRLDMETMVDELTPAYASDLVFPTPNGFPISMAWDPITNGPIVGIELASSGNGIWVQNNNQLVPQGFIDSGLVTNNIPDDKIAAMVSARQIGPGSISFEVNADGQGYDAATPLSPNTPSSTPTLLTTLRRYEEMNVSVQLNAEAGNSFGPTLKRWTLKSLPAVVSGTDVSYVVMLYSQVGSHAIKRTVDPYVELAWLEGLRLSQQPVLISEGNPQQTLYTATAVVDSIDWLPEHERDAAPYFGWDGVAVVYFKTLVG